MPWARRRTCRGGAKETKTEDNRTAKRMQRIGKRIQKAGKERAEREQRRCRENADIRKRKETRQDKRCLGLAHPIEFL